MPRHFLPSILVLVLAAWPVVRAADNARDKSAAEICAAIEAFQGYFNKGDAKSLAACWTRDGEFVGPQGECIVGRDKIETAFHKFIDAHKNAKLRLGLVAWRPLGENVASVTLLSELTPAPADMESEPTATAVLIKTEGRWLIGSMREANDAAPSPRVHLKRLQWMVGDWTTEAKDNSGVAMHSTCDWTRNGSYLIRKFTVERKDAASLAGTEVIGWDPRNRRIRSWTFDSNGGFGESVWTPDAGRWTVKYTGTLADGSDVSATRVVTVVDADTVTVRFTERVTNGEKQPDLPEATLKRSAATSGAKTTEREPATLPKQLLP